MKLGVLSRAGIVATLFGVPAVTFYRASEKIEAKRALGDYLYKHCMHGATTPPIPSDPKAFMDSCNETLRLMQQTRDQWTAALTEVCVWALLLWLILTLLYWSVRWVMNGRTLAVESAGS